MSDRTKLGLSLEKDGGYSKLIVFMSAVLSGFTFGLPGFLGALTVEVIEPTLFIDTLTVYDLLSSGRMKKG